VLERGVLLAQSFDESVPEAERTEARTKALELRPRSNPITEALLVDHFERASRWLPKGDPFLAAIAGGHERDGGVDWAAALKALARSDLARSRALHELLDGDDAAAKWAASTDPGVAAARALWPRLRDAQREDEASSRALTVAMTRLGQALHAVYGTNVSPDATMTLRFSDGLVKGYEYNGTIAPWATTLYGLFARGAEFGNAYPFDVPQPWLDAEAKLDLTKRVCFVSTNDIVGGNSGSAVVDKELRVVGLVFDGNIESLPNDFYYTQERARAVSVHTDAIEAALQHVYGMGRVLDELRAGAK
jgi:hypothetical protein